MQTEEILHRLEHDPESVRRLPEVRTPEIFDAWIRRVLALTSANPRQGLPHVKTALGIAPTVCDVVQCFGVQAAAHRNLGELGKAQDALELAFQLGWSCPGCEADLLRRRALLFGAKGMRVEALAEADSAVEAYLALGTGPDHDLNGNGLADSYQDRGSIRGCFGFETDDEQLIRAAVNDFGEALALAHPRDHQQIHFDALLNTGIALRKAGGFANLEAANQHIRKAQKCFRGRKHEASREKAHLDWQTAMVRFELRKHQGDRKIVTESASMIRKQLERALSDFLEVGMPAESAAVAADLTLLAFPQRMPIMDLMGDTKSRIKAKWNSFDQDVRMAFQPVFGAMDAVHQAAAADVTVLGSIEFESRMRDTIKRLRETCGEAARGQLLPCLLTWPSTESMS